MDVQESAEVQAEIEAAREAVETHKKDMDRALEALQQFARGKVSLVQFTDLKNAVGGFTPAKLAVEKAKRILKAKLQEALKE